MQRTVEVVHFPHFLYWFVSMRRIFPGHLTFGVAPLMCTISLHLVNAGECALDLSAYAAAS